MLPLVIWQDNEWQHHKLNYLLMLFLVIKQLNQFMMLPLVILPVKAFRKKELN